MLPRLLVAIVLFPIANAVMFGALLLLTLSVPFLHADLDQFIWAAVKASLLVAGPIAWECAPALLTDAEKHPK
jgi:hypothetical protein